MTAGVICAKMMKEDILEALMKASILIHPTELSRRWIDRMTESRIDTLGLHPVGGANSIISLEGLVEQMKSEEFRSLIDYARERGLEVEYEFHAFGYLLPRKLFDTHPEYFRMNKQGERTPSLNFCPSSKEALDIVADNALTLAKSLYGSAHRYFFWSDDARGGVCSCPKCKALTPSDQQLTVLRAIIRKLREEIPDAMLAYLAYYSTLDVPASVESEEGIFLEFAPIDKWHVRVGRNTEECISGEVRERESSCQLLSFFGKSGSRVLEYWIDNSLFSE